MDKQHILNEMKRTAEENGGKLRDELLDREIFYTLEEARVLVDGWRQHYDWGLVTHRTSTEDSDLGGRA